MIIVAMMQSGIYMLDYHSVTTHELQFLTVCDGRVLFYFIFCIVHGCVWARLYCKFSFLSS